MEKLNVTADNLNDVLGFDTGAIEVHEDGTVTRVDTYSPEVVVDVDKDGQITDQAEDDMEDSVQEQGWEMLHGWTGQSGYRGPIMRASEYIGGRLAEYILEEPGTYAVASVETSDPEDEDAAGWAILRKLI